MDVAAMVTILRYDTFLSHKNVCGYYDRPSVMAQPLLPLTLLNFRSIPFQFSAVQLHLSFNLTTVTSTCFIL